MGIGSRPLRIGSRLLLVAGSIILTLYVEAVPAAAGSGAEVWEELLACRPQENGVPVAGVVLVRDAFTFRLESGAFFPLTEVSGRIVGGVFRGKGRFELKPATESERSFLGRRLGQKRLPVLTDVFEEAVFLFTDGSGEELLLAEPSAQGQLEKLASIYNGALEKAGEALHVDLRLRLVPDLVEAAPAAQGLFLACFNGHKLPPSVAAFSPRGLLRAWLETDSGPETTSLIVLRGKKGGIWYSERPIAAQASTPAHLSADLVALHYSIETTIRRNLDIEGRTTLRLRATRDGVRVIPLDIFAKLRLSSIRLKRRDGPAADIPYIQGDEKSADPVLVVLDRPLALGEEAELSAQYQGDEVLHKAGGINFYVGARQNWYPALNGFRDWADYDLEYRVPKNIANKAAERNLVTIVSTGRPVDSGEEGDSAVFRYTTEGPVRVAGFNFGIFRLIKNDDPDSGVKIRVYPNPSAPFTFLDFREMAASGSMDGGVARTARYDPVSMAEDILADCINTARVGTLYFGPLPQNDIAVTEQPEWTFGQSWPTLIYIPFVAFLDWMTRDMVWITIGEAKYFAEEVTPHEFAHQWWGHAVGSATYRDVWLEEGLAEFTVGLVVEKALGPKASIKFWERARKDILGTSWHPRRDTWKTGPISLGPRLMVGGGPGASADYQAIVYDKGAYVVHMLRNLFWDAQSPNPEQPFIDTMRDFAKTWAGRNPTTADFQKIVERHAPAACGGDMGWFFREWIEGTAIPKVKAAVRVEEAGGGRYRLVGEIAQSEVPDDFRSVLPVYVEFEKNRLERCAQVSVTGNKTLSIRQEVSLSEKPLRVLVDPNHEWLRR
ncbi:MAG: M1 family aminopeptidase [Acidobacteriota bacterium]